jgi:Flp pilus assembly protein TadD
MAKKDGKDPLAQSDAHNERGIELADRGWLDEAIREFRKAIELDPQSAHAHDNLATVFAEKRQFRDALSEYLAAIKLEPDSPTAHYNLACFLTTHAVEMAVDEFQESLELDPEYSDAHLNLGLAYADLGKMEDALKEMRRAIELAPDDAFARHELAVLLMDEGDYRGAILQLKDVVRLEPENYEGHLDLGICYAQKGFYEEAERSYRKAEEQKGDDVLIVYNLAALYALWGKPDAALEYLRRSISLDATKVKSWLASDAMFDPLKGSPEFEAALAGTLN